MKTKTKLTIAVASILSVAALAGTGYAGWVISKDASRNTQGNVTVYDVTDKTVTISDVTLTPKKDSIVWGKATAAEKGDDSFQYNWFNDSSDRSEEFFTPEVTFKVKNNSTNDTAKPKITATIEVKDNEVERADKSKGAYAYCLSKKYINGPAADTKTAITIPVDDSFLSNTANNNEFSGTLSVQNGLFGWGSHFETGSEEAKKIVNPYIFYNSHAHQDAIESNKTYYEDALEVMNGSIAKLDGVQFIITINAAHAA